MEIYILLECFLIFVIIRMSQRSYLCVMQISKKNSCVLQQRSPNSAFIIHLLESIISKLSSSENSFFWLVSVAEQTGLSLALSETPKADFAAS